MTDLRQASDAARAIAAAALGRDPGPMAAAESSSHCVYVGSDAVVKIIDAGGHSRLGREIALAPHLPAGLTAPLLGSGLCPLGTREVRYACYARVPGTAPGMGMPGVDSVTARLLAEEAVQRLGGLHSWMPSGNAGQTLREPLDHGGFVSQAALLAEVENLAALDRDGIVPRHHLDGLTAIAERAPLRARAVVPVHADCHWGNWLAYDRSVTALLDFEWARFGEPADDWFFLGTTGGATPGDASYGCQRVPAHAADRAGAPSSSATRATVTRCKDPFVTLSHTQLPIFHPAPARKSARVLS
jgi:hypothetical protein